MAIGAKKAPVFKNMLMTQYAGKETVFNAFSRCGCVTGELESDPPGEHLPIDEIKT